MNTNSLLCYFRTPLARLAVATLFALPLLTHATVKQLPTEDFTKFNEIGQVRISPNGDFVSASVRRGEENQVVILDSKTLKPLHRHRFQQDKFSISGYRWVSDKRLVFYLSVKVPTEQERPFVTGALTAADYNGRYEADLGGGRIIDPLWEDDKRVLVLTGTYSRPYLAKLNVRSGALRDRASLPPNAFATSSILLDSEKRPRYARVRTEYNIDELFYKDPAKTSWEKIAEFPYPGGAQVPIQMSADGNSVFLLDNLDGGTQAVAKADLRLQNVETLFRDDLTDITNFYTDEESNVYAYASGIGKPELRVLDPQNARIKTLGMLQGAFPGQDVQIVNATRDGKQMMIFVSSDRHPGTYYIFDLEDNQLRFLFDTRSWVDPELSAPMDAFVFEARDGLQVTALLTTPIGEAPAQGWPLIVHPHGGPHGPYDTWGYNPLIQFLANRGYAVLQVNFRGSGGHGANFEMAGFREWGRKIQYDIIDGAKAALESYPLDADKVAIMGASFGGYSALQSPILAPEFFKAAIGVVGVYDFKLMYRAGDIRGRFSGKRYLEKALGNDPDEFAEFSPLARADELTVPVMLVQGERDDRAPVIHSDRLAKRLKELGHPHEYVIMENEGHGFYKDENRIAWYEMMETFLARHL